MFPHAQVTHVNSGFWDHLPILLKCNPVNMATLHSQDQSCSALPSLNQQCNTQHTRAKGSEPVAEMWTLCCEDERKGPQDDTSTIHDALSQQGPAVLRDRISYGLN